MAPILPNPQQPQFARCLEKRKQNFRKKMYIRHGESTKKVHGIFHWIRHGESDKNFYFLQFAWIFMLMMGAEGR